MALASINTNIQAQYAAQNLRHGIDISKAAAVRLASGNRITIAADDASGLSIGTGLKTDTGTLKASLRNAAQAQSILNIADGALNNVADILQRMKSLVVQSNAASMGEIEKGYINDELDKLSTEIDRIADQTKFNGKAILDGSFDGEFQVSFGANDTIRITFESIRAGDLNGMISDGIPKTYKLNLVDKNAVTAFSDLHSSALGTLEIMGGFGPINMEGSSIGTNVVIGGTPFSWDFTNNATAALEEADTNSLSTATFSAVNRRAISVERLFIKAEVTENGVTRELLYEWDPKLVAEAIDTAINDIKSARASVGAVQSRFNFATTNLETSIQNTDSARSEYLDSDISEESSAFASAQVRIQASVSVLAKANMLAYNLLKLIE